MTETIILIVDDLMFLPRLESGLRQLGYQPAAATDQTAVTRALFKSPVLVIIDLFSQSIDWADLIRLIKKSKVGPVPVLGFGPHVDLDLREKALAAGCDAVVGRGAVATQLPQLVKKHKRQVEKESCAESPPDLLQEGIELLNAGEYFESHELIEEAWLAEERPIRLMYQGVLQIGVACHHVQNKNWRGAMKMLERGLPKVQRYAPHCQGLDLARLISDAEAIRQELVRLGPEWAGEFDTRLFPTIDLPSE